MWIIVDGVVCSKPHIDHVKVAVVVSLTAHEDPVRRDALAQQIRHQLEDLPPTNTNPTPSVTVTP